MTMHCGIGKNLKGRIMDKFDRTFDDVFRALRTCVHECSHTVISYVTGCGVGEIRASRDGHHGYFSPVPPVKDDGAALFDDPKSETEGMVQKFRKAKPSRDYTIRTVTWLLAGAAVDQLDGHDDWKKIASSDIDRVAGLVSPEDAVACFHRSGALVQKYRGTIDKLAFVLFQRGELVEPEISKLLESYGIEAGVEKQQQRAAGPKLMTRETTMTTAGPRLGKLYGYIM
jgi:hypothetical protein